MNNDVLEILEKLKDSLSDEEFSNVANEIESIQKDAQALEEWLRTEQQALLKKRILESHRKQ